MRVHPAVLAAVLALLASGCEAPPEEAAPGPTVAPAEVSVEGATTTLVNRDIPLWDGARELVEEASIGSRSGDEAYLLGNVTSIAASDDTIYLSDFQTVSIRAYDMAGRHLFDVGSGGNGPGEFRRPFDIGLRRDGQLMVRDQVQRRVHVFSPDGTLIEDWATERGNRSTIALDGSVYVLRENIFPDAEGKVTVSVKKYEADGTEHDWADFPDRPPPPLIETVGNQLELMAMFLGIGADWRSTRWIPFGPRVVAEVAPNGAMLSGRADAYRFEVMRPNGSTLVVEKEWTPTPISPAEADWYQRRLTALWRAATDESWTWLEGEIPPHKGAFLTIVPALDGSFWVVREMAGVALDDCDANPKDFFGFDEAPCWHQPYIADVFDEEGRFLGSVSMPDRIRYHVRPFIRGDMVVALVEDVDGVAYVRRFRLLSPG